MTRPAPSQQPAKPAPEQLWKAVETYLRIAYGSTPLPAAVRGRLSSLRLVPADELYESNLLERFPPEVPTRFSLRLGNPFYPHMKLTIDRRPDKKGYLFRADTHDRHCAPPQTSREYGTFCQLMEDNRKLAAEIEAAWEAEGLPTLKGFLKQDLAKRQAKSDPPAGTGTDTTP